MPVMAFATGESEKNIKAPLKHVTVYPDRAQLSHETDVDIPSGKSVIILGGLSPYIDEQSVQVRGFGDFMILSVNQQNNYIQNLDELPEVKSLKSQIEELQIKVEDENTAINTLKEKEAFLVANRAVLSKETSFSIEQLKNLMDMYTSNMDQAATTILKKGRTIKEYQKQIDALQKQVNDWSGRQQLPSGEISVTVSADKAVSGKLLFSYVVTNAGWVPSYDIRVDDITKPVNILFKANVAQSTGVDWKDVRLSFSNATPSVSGDLPVLSPWFIDFYIPVSIYKSRMIESKKEAPMAMEKSAVSVADNAPEASVAPVEKQMGETMINFDVAVPCSIACDGKNQTIELQHSTVPADYRYVTIPKKSTLAYLTASITDWAKLSLQSGEATLYFENTFVGKTNLNVAQLKDTLTFSLGTDNSILVKREKRQDFTNKKTIGANKTETYSFLITVRNNKPGPVEITLRDQIPISANSGITVEAPELSGGNLDPETGEIKWDLSLKPQETKQIILTYSIKYPKDKNVILE